MLPGAARRFTGTKTSAIARVACFIMAEQCHNLSSKMSGVSSQGHPISDEQVLTLAR
jgi:hypothetical protein